MLTVAATGAGAARSPKLSALSRIVVESVRCSPLSASLSIAEDHFAVRYDAIVTCRENHRASVKNVKRLAPARLRP
jgi:hypothetical protein